MAGVMAFLLGVPVGWFAAKTVVPIVFLGTLVYVLFHPDRLRRMGEQWSEAIRAVSEAP